MSFLTHHLLQMTSKSGEAVGVAIQILKVRILHLGFQLCVNIGEVWPSRFFRQGGSFVESILAVFVGELFMGLINQEFKLQLKFSMKLNKAIGSTNFSDQQKKVY